MEIKSDYLTKPLYCLQIYTMGKSYAKYKATLNELNLVFIDMYIHIYSAVKCSVVRRV